MTSYEHKVKNIYLGDPWWSPWWRPWENTYAYYPLTANANDTSGNNRNLIADSSITYSTQNGAFLPNSRHTGMFEPFNISTTSQRTFSRWQNTLWLAWQEDAKGIDLAPWSWWTARIVTSRYWANGMQTMNYNSSSPAIVSISTTVNTWHYYTITIWEYRQIKLYADWVLKNTGTVNSFTSWFFRWGQEHNGAYPRQLYGYLKDIIIESKARTDQEVKDYYNQTKSNYWL